MTENKPVAWLYNAPYGRDILSAVDPSRTFGVTNVRPLYRHPPAPQPDADPAVEAALKEATGLAMALWRKHYTETAPNWKPLPDLPGVLSQIDNMTAGLAPKAPDADPAVEAARRKALKAIFAKLAEHPTRDDRFTVGLPLAALRDLVGEPRKQPEQKVWGYDEPAPTAGIDLSNCVMTNDRTQGVCFGTKPAAPARLSVDQLARVVTDAGFQGADPRNSFIQGLARAVHKAIYGKGE